MMMRELTARKRKRRLISCGRQGNTILYIARESSLIGIIALSDTLRDESTLCLECFRELGVETDGNADRG